MRTIDKIIIHCSATPEGRHHTVGDIRRWHTDPPPDGRGWSDIGYHWVIYLDGSIHAGRPESEVGAHTGGQNEHSIGVCYVGGTDAAGAPKDTRTPAQRTALNSLVARLLAAYPGATVHGHREFANKACPSFDVRAEKWEPQKLLNLAPQTAPTQLRRLANQLLNIADDLELS